MPTDRRQHQRFEIDMTSSIDFGKVLEVQLKDVSLGGMAFETKQRPSVGKGYEVRLQLGSDKITVTGKAVWCHLAATINNEQGDLVPIYRAGLRFEPALAPEMATMMQKLGNQAFLTEDASSSAAVNIAV